MSMLLSAAAGIEVLSGEEKIVQAIREFQDNTKRIWCACVDSSLPQFSVGRVRQGYIEARKRGVRILYITEMTSENLPYCMHIMKFAELRHLEGVRGNFAVSETEYVAGIKRGKSIVRLVRSNIRELVLQQRYVFDVLWRLATPAKERIRQIKES